MLDIPSSSGQTHNSMMIDFTIRSINTNNSLSKHLDRVLSKVPEIRPRTNQNKSTLNTTLTKIIPKTPIQLEIKQKTRNTNTLPAYHDVKHRTMTKQLRIRYKHPRSPMPNSRNHIGIGELNDSLDTRTKFFSGSPADPHEHSMQLSNFLNNSPNLFVFEERPRTNYHKKSANNSSATIKRPTVSATKLPKDDFIATTFTTLEDVMSTQKTPTSYSPEKKFFYGRLEPNIINHFPANLPEYEIVTGKDGGPSLRIKKDPNVRSIFTMKPKTQVKLNTVTLTDNILDSLPSTKNENTSTLISRGAKMFSRNEDRGKSHSPNKNLPDPNFPVEGKGIHKRRDTNEKVSSSNFDYMDAYFSTKHSKTSNNRIKAIPGY